MKKLTPDQWEQKYIVGTVDRFDQKYTMFNRYKWDPEVKDVIEDWSTIGRANCKPGYALENLSIRKASNNLNEMFRVFNNSKPNQNIATKGVMSAIVRVKPEHAKAVKPPTTDRIDIRQTQRMNDIIKKVAFFLVPTWLVYVNWTNDGCIRILSLSAGRL